MVIPTFNGLPYVAETFRSVAAQTYPNVEICICDGGSTDGTVEWIHTLGSDVRSEFLPPGTSAAENWTRCTRMATGSFIKLLCQDDLLYPDALKHQVETLLSHPGATFTVAQRDVISASGRVIARARGLSGLTEGRVSGAQTLRATYLRGTNVLGEPHALLFAREALLSAMPWTNERPYLLDLDTYTRVLQRADCRVLTMKESIGAFRVSSSSWSTRLVAQQEQQFASWQREYEAHNPTTISSRMRARLALRSQTLARRLVYAWVTLRGDMSR